MKYNIESGLAKDFKPELGDVFIDRDITEPLTDGSTRNVYILSNLNNPNMVPAKFGYLAEDGSHSLFMGNDSVRGTVEDTFNKLGESVELVIGKNYFPNAISTVLYKLYENSGALNNTTTTTTLAPDNPDTTLTTTLRPEDISEQNMLEVLMSIRLGLRMAHHDYKYAMNAPTRYDEHSHLRKVDEEIAYASNLLTRLLMVYNAPIDYDTWDGSNYMEYLKKHLEVDTNVTDHYPNDPHNTDKEDELLNGISTTTSTTQVPGITLTTTQRGSEQID